MATDLSVPCNLEEALVYYIQIHYITNDRMRSELLNQFMQNIPDLLSTLPPEKRFPMPEIMNLLEQLVADDKFSAATTADDFNATQHFPLLVAKAPWKPEYHTIKLYSGSLNSRVSKAFASRILIVFLLLGYVPGGDSSTLELISYPDVELCYKVAFSLCLAACECRFIHSISQELGGRYSDSHVMQARMLTRGGSKKLLICLATKFNKLNTVDVLKRENIFYKATGVEGRLLDLPCSHSIPRRDSGYSSSPGRAYRVHDGETTDGSSPCSDRPTESVRDSKASTNSLYSTKLVSNAVPSKHNPASTVHGLRFGNDAIYSTHSSSTNRHSPASSAHSSRLGSEGISGRHRPAPNGHNTASYGHSPATNAHSPAPSGPSPAPSGPSPASSGPSPASNGHSSRLVSEGISGRYRPPPSEPSPAPNGHSSKLVSNVISSRHGPTSVAYLESSSPTKRRADRLSLILSGAPEKKYESHANQTKMTPNTRQTTEVHLPEHSSSFDHSSHLEHLRTDRLYKELSSVVDEPSSNTDTPSNVDDHLDAVLKRFDLDINKTSTPSDEHMPNTSSKVRNISSYPTDTRTNQLGDKNYLNSSFRTTKSFSDGLKTVYENHTGVDKSQPQVNGLSEGASAGILRKSYTPKYVLPTTQSLLEKKNIAIPPLDSLFEKPGPLETDNSGSRHKDSISTYDGKYSKLHSLRARSSVADRIAGLPNKNDPWICPKCTLENHHKLYTCMACYHQRDIESNV